jgi:hypothetical protein
MKTTEKVIIAGLVGTSFMTLYSYLKAKREKQEYVEPVLLNKLVDNAQNLPEVDDNDTHPIGWGLHYATGIAFMGAYYVLWKTVLLRPTPARIIIVGTVSGAVGITVWKLMFSQHKNPPKNYRYGYYRQLLIAHIIFSLAGIVTYKALNSNSEQSEKQNSLP